MYNLYTVHVFCFPLLPLLIPSSHPPPLCRVLLCVCRPCLRRQAAVPLNLWTVRTLSSCSIPRAPLASQRASCTRRLATCSMHQSLNRWALLLTCTAVALCLALQYVFDYRPGDVYACVADIGWITGHSYVVYGPLCNGATTVLFESHPAYPNPGLYMYMYIYMHV